MSQHRCIDCGTALHPATGFGLMPTEVADGRPHTDSRCVEYIKAALNAANKHAEGLANLATHLQAELDQQRHRADEARSQALKDAEHAIMNGPIVRGGAAARALNEALAAVRALEELKP